VAREQGSDLIGFTQAVGSKNDGFRFGQGHLNSDVDAPTKWAGYEVSTTLPQLKAKTASVPDPSSNSRLISRHCRPVRQMQNRATPVVKNSAQSVEKSYVNRGLRGRKLSDAVVENRFLLHHSPRPFEGGEESITTELLA
jgi:hypothetical protein